jgi:hypothetical protein
MLVFFDPRSRRRPRLGFGFNRIRAAIEEQSHFQDATLFGALKPFYS